jgi:hypothetical protein
MQQPEEVQPDLRPHSVPPKQPVRPSPRKQPTENEIALHELSEEIERSNLGNGNNIDYRQNNNF